MMQLWIWRNIRVQLPGDWEMLQFSRDPSRGRCAFADRYEFRFELDWRTVDGTPDIGRMVTDYAAQLHEEGAQEPHGVEHGAWMGVFGVADGQKATRYIRHFAEEQYLLELVFLWPDERQASIEHEVLDSVGIECGAQSPWQRWCAFGLDFRTFRPLRFEGCEVAAANAELKFVDRKGRHTECFGRRGLVSEWLRVPVSDWLANWVPREVQVVSTTIDTVRAHNIQRLRGSRRRCAVAGLMGRNLPCDAAAWICPEDDRLYSVYRIGGKAERTAAGVGCPSLSCCSALELSV